MAEDQFLQACFSPCRMEKLAVYEDDITLSKIPSFNQYALTREYFQYHSGKKKHEADTEMPPLP